MTVEAGLYDYLINDATVSGVVSTRVYPVIIPQNPTYPCISYSTSGAIRHSTLVGQDNFVGAQIDIDCWAETYSSAKDLQNKVRASVQNYQGLMGTINVDSVFVYDPVDIYEDDVFAYRCTIPVTIYHTEV